MTYVEKMVAEIGDKVANHHCNKQMAALIVEKIIADTEEKCRNPIPIIELPGVKELVEAAYRAAYRQGFQGGEECGAENSENYTKAYEDNYVYEYMKALEAK